MRAYVLLSQNPTILEGLQGQLDEVIVDEFQDINRLDFVLVDAIAKKAGLVVTGDDDQAIYGFRGCTPGFIIDFEKHLGRPVESHELQINYRCPPVIVEHADRLIRHNTWRIPKNPRAASDAVAQIHVISSLSAGLEATSIVKLIQRVRASDPTLGFNNFVVLYRTNAQSLPLQVEFVREGIPYFVRPQDNILHNESLDRLLSILRLKLALADKMAPSARDSARTVCSFFRRVEPNVAARVEARFREGGDFMETMLSEQVYRALPERGRDMLPYAMHELLSSRSLMPTLDVIAERFRGVYGMIGSLEEVVNDWVPLGEIYRSLRASVATSRNSCRPLRPRWKKAGHARGPRPQDGRAAADVFQIQGLAMAHGHSDDMQRGPDPASKGAGRGRKRLFYVAMTRASSNLVISYVKSACGTDVPPSRFLYEAGLIEKPGQRRRGGPAVPSANGYVALAKSRVFHRPECRAVREMGERLTKFATREEAVATGKKPCAQCKP